MCFSFYRFTLTATNSIMEYKILHSNITKSWFHLLPLHLFALTKLSQQAVKILGIIFISNPEDHEKEFER